MNASPYDTDAVSCCDAWKAEKDPASHYRLDAYEEAIVIQRIKQGRARLARVVECFGALAAILATPHYIRTTINRLDGVGWDWASTSTMATDADPCCGHCACFGEDTDAVYAALEAAWHTKLDKLDTVRATVNGIEYRLTAS